MVTGVIVTRGDRDITPIIESVMPHVEFVRVWDNCQAHVDLSVYGRYAACHGSLSRLVYVQDDDCLVSDIPAIIAAWQPGHVVCNMPERFRRFYPDSALVGFGACFQWQMAYDIFDRFFTAQGIDEFDPMFQRTCDVVFTALAPRILVDVEHVDMWYAHAPNRMWKQESHVSERAAMLERARAVRDGL
jgi:hypothetical protein